MKLLRLSLDLKKLRWCLPRLNIHHLYHLPKSLVASIRWGYPACKTVFSLGALQRHSVVSIDRF